MNHDAAGRDLIALKDVPALLPRRRGKKVHYSTVYRWVTKGARGKKLESWLVGGIRFTTRVALRDFLKGDLHVGEEQKTAGELKRALYGEPQD